MSPHQQKVQPSPVHSWNPVEQVLFHWMLLWSGWWFSPFFQSKISSSVLFQFQNVFGHLHFWEQIMEYLITFHFSQLNPISISNSHLNETPTPVVFWLSYPLCWHILVNSVCVVLSVKENNFVRIGQKEKTNLMTKKTTDSHWAQKPKRTKVCDDLSKIFPAQSCGRSLCGCWNGKSKRNHKRQSALCRVNNKIKRKSVIGTPNIHKWTCTCGEHLVCLQLNLVNAWLQSSHHILFCTVYLQAACWLQQHLK